MFISDQSVTESRALNVRTALTRNNGLLARVTTPSGRYLDFTHDTSNRIERIEDITGRAVTYEYNAAGTLWKATDPDNKVEVYTYDASGRMETVIDRRENRMVFNEYDANGRVWRQTLADDGQFTYAYTTDPSTGKVIRTEITDPRTYVERLDFNEAGYITSKTMALGTAIAQTTTYEYQSGTNLLEASVDALSRRTEYGYDSAGNLTSVKRLAGTADEVTETMTYTSDFNQIATHTDALNHTTTFTYDPQGRLTEVKDPLNHATLFEYNSAGQITRIYDPRNQPIDFGYAIYDLQSVVGADRILTHPADRILTQGWQPVVERPAVDKCNPGRFCWSWNEARGRLRTDLPWQLAPRRALGVERYTEDSAWARLRAASRCLPRRLAAALL